MNIALVNPRRRFVTNKRGLGYQVPLGLVFIGGPLIDSGHCVQLFDNDVMGLPPEKLAAHVAQSQPDCVMIGHAGSMPAHDCAVATILALRQRLPSTILVYGGLYPTLAYQSIMSETPEVDIIAHGEGEATVIELAAALERDRTAMDSVNGITWRKNGRVVTNAARKPIENLDQYRPGWELLDWDSYKLFNFGRASGMQFSRGCIHHCPFCSQWRFWKKWRHRSPQNFAAHVVELARTYGVNFVWLADEFFAADKEAAHQALLEVKRHNLGISMNLNMTARSVIENAELLPLYRSTGVVHVVVGVESVRDDVVAKIGKGNSFEVSKQAMNLLADNGIVSTASMVFGLDDEDAGKILRTLVCLYRMDPDIFNACHATPLPDTKFNLDPKRKSIVESDISKWNYRTPVVATAKLPTWLFFWLIKFCEIVFHLRPQAIKRLVFGRSRGGAAFKTMLRGHYRAGIWVVLDEVLRFFHTRKPASSSQKKPDTQPMCISVSRSECSKD